MGDGIVVPLAGHGSPAPPVADLARYRAKRDRAGHLLALSRFLATAGSHGSVVVTGGLLATLPAADQTGRAGE